MLIEGAALARWRTGPGDELIRRLVAPDTATSLARIRARAGHLPDRDGGGSEEIAALRDAIAAFGDPRIPYGLKIVAPHTHWDEGWPIIISHAGDRYLLSEQQPRVGAKYRPVSFVFHATGPVPYEWADETVHVREEDYRLLMNCIVRVNEAVHRWDLPFGLSIDYRFKQPLDPVLTGTSELQGIDGPELATLMTESHFLENFSDVEMEQVAWHAFHDDHGLQGDEHAVAAKIRETLAGIDSPHLRHHLEQAVRRAFGR